MPSSPSTPVTASSLCSVNRIPPVSSIQNVIVEVGIDECLVDDGLRMAHEAFAKKFRIGFRNADDYVQLFADAIDRSSCITAASEDGRLLGMLTFRTTKREFYRLSFRSLLGRFNPVRATLMLINLLMLDDRVAADQFVLETIVVSPSTRGMGVGTALMLKAKELAMAMGKKRMVLGVILENKGAQLLYQRLGYRVLSKHDDVFVRFATGSKGYLHMEHSID